MLPALLAGVLPSVIKSVLDVGKTAIERTIPDKAAQAAAKRELEKELKNFEAQQETQWNDYMLQYEGAAESQSSIIKFMRGSVRPILTYAFAGVFVFAFLNPSSFNSAMLELLWTLNLLTLGFWFGGRTLEKLGINAAGISKIRQARKPFDAAAEQERAKVEEDRRRLEIRLDQIEKDRQRESQEYRIQRDEFERLRKENADLHSTIIDLSQQKKAA